MTARRPAEHGTRLRYQRDGCRCPLCRAANTAYNRPYRAAYYARLRADPERWARTLAVGAAARRRRRLDPAKAKVDDILRARRQRLRRAADPDYDARVRRRARDRKRRERARRNGST